MNSQITEGYRSTHSWSLLFLLLPERRADLNQLVEIAQWMLSVALNEEKPKYSQFRS